jgi:D-beta-D-heptose 7-phosphate kinase/D-beta-D-heptose 1-phosphate adenosyltransferase
VLPFTIHDLEKLIDQFRNRRILVAGDVMLDQYIEGGADRISPEAPVPVVSVQSERSMPGGAANVAANAAALGAQVAVVGVVGPDPQASLLSRALAANGVEAVFVEASGRPTISKTRVVAHGQQIVRIDREDHTPLPEGATNDVIRQVTERLPHLDCLVLSDYAKGVLTRRVTRALIECASRLYVPVVVDPKRTDFQIYDGAALITPNRKEALQAAHFLGLDTISVPDAGARILSALQHTGLLVTCGEDGMMLFRHHLPVWHVAATAREVFDVTGAGDTVVAVLALALSAGLSLEHAAALANHAAGIVVAKRGTAVVTPAELMAIGP